MMGTAVNEKMVKLCALHLLYCQYSLLFIYVESPLLLYSCKYS